MVSKKLWSFLLAVAISVVAVAISIGSLEISPALALERAGAEPVYLDPLAQSPPPDHLQFVAVFTDDLAVEITDLGGVVVGEGVHGGRVKCNSTSCSQHTYLRFDAASPEPSVYEYRFATRMAIDPVAEAVVVGGTGTISSNGQKERFSFTATFQNNGDGTVSVTYIASRPDASYIIPEAPGTFDIFSRP
jgi:hypothetical protein